MSKHFTEGNGFPCDALLAVEVPPDDEKAGRTGVLACDREAGHSDAHRIGSVTWPNTSPTSPGGQS